MLKRFPIQLQHDSMDCGAACLTMISAHYGLKLTQDTIRELCHTTRIGVSMLSISHAAEQLGFRTVGGANTFVHSACETPLTLHPSLESSAFCCVAQSISSLVF